MYASPYNDRVRRHFAAAGHAGDARGPAATVSRGDIRLVLSAELDGERLKRLRYRVYGCPHAIAAAEEACAALQGRDIAALRQAPLREIMVKLEIPVDKTGLILLLEDALLALHETIKARNINEN